MPHRKFYIFLPKFIETFSSETKRKCWSSADKYFLVEKSQKTCEGAETQNEASWKAGGQFIVTIHYLVFSLIKDFRYNDLYTKYFLRRHPVGS